MVKNHAIKNLIILLIYLFSFSKSEGLEWLYYDFSTNSIQRIIKGGDQIQNYGVDFEYLFISKVPPYFKIEVTSDDENPAPTICFSSTDRDCKEKEHFVENPEGKTAIMWLKSEEFIKDEDELYIHIECAKENCNYTLKINGFQDPVGSNNNKNLFSF